VLIVGVPFKKISWTMCGIGSACVRACLHTHGEVGHGRDMLNMNIQRLQQCANDEIYGFYDHAIIV